MSVHFNRLSFRGHELQHRSSALQHESHQLNLRTSRTAQRTAQTAQKSHETALKNQLTTQTSLTVSQPYHKVFTFPLMPKDGCNCGWFWYCLGAIRPTTRYFPPEPKPKIIRSVCDCDHRGSQTVRMDDYLGRPLRVNEEACRVDPLANVIRDARK